MIPKKGESHTMPMPMEELQKRIGYTFRNQAYLERALTHSSFANETGAHNHHLCCNERLEFLGDSVLSLIASRYLFMRFPDYKEGELSQLKGVLYFTDGKGIYPRRPPAYTTAFIFVGRDPERPPVPAWAIKLGLEEEDLL